ncbi:PepSY domain-containing protein [Salipaludibacillus sp. HK11]|uniref:PepSY domain-containing protein n=1 Tax=Salipaludibacillus sp. HK11 TaxID=3394320 RepID=UPI0039FDA9E3
MNKKNYLITAIAVLISGIALVFYFSFSSENILAENEIELLLQERYTGEVIDIQSDSNVAKVEFHSTLGQYEIEVSAADGRILTFEHISDDTEFQVLEQDEELDNYITVEQVGQIIDDTLSEEVTIIEAQLEESEDGVTYYLVQVDMTNETGTFEIDASTGEILLFSVEENTPLEPISEQEAIDIALSEHAGEIDDVDLEEGNGRLIYEIEVENDETGIDADIIIDAYSGEVLSIEYDD